MTVLIDTDNAMGSPSGDVDDAFAIAALIRSGVHVAAISSVAGNTSEARAHDNNQRLCRILGWRGPLLRGVEVPHFLRSAEPMRILALGPLTNLVGAPASEIIIVGGNSTSRGRWPPVWPHEFNLTKNRSAAYAVLQSSVPLTIFPLNVARQLFCTRKELDTLKGPVADYLRRGSKRWFRRLRALKLTGRFPIYDLAAALYVVSEDGFTMERTTIDTRANTFIRFGAGSREVLLCRALHRRRLQQRAAELLSE